MAKHNAYVMRALKAIQSDDPDGWETQPKPHHYKAFEADSICRYGRQIWEIYRKGNWAESSDV